LQVLNFWSYAQVFLEVRLFTLTLLSFVPHLLIFFYGPVAAQLMAGAWPHGVLACPACATSISLRGGQGMRRLGRASSLNRLQAGSVKRPRTGGGRACTITREGCPCRLDRTAPDPSFRGCSLAMSDDKLKGSGRTAKMHGSETPPAPPADNSRLLPAVKLL
jgi:hypothetical protein